MPIRKQLQELGVFEPPLIDAMAKAYTKTCQDLALPEQDQEARRIVATRIIDLARNGITNSETLHRRVMEDSQLDL